jgi:hypothetical protein
MIDAIDNREVGAVGGCRETTRCTGGKRGGLFLRRENARALERDIDAEVLAPKNLASGEVTVAQMAKPFASSRASIPTRRAMRSERSP